MHQHPHSFQGKFTIVNDGSTAINGWKLVVTLSTTAEGCDDKPEPRSFGALCQIKDYQATSAPSVVEGRKRAGNQRGPMRVVFWLRPALAPGGLPHLCATAGVCWPWLTPPMCHRWGLAGGALTLTQPDQGSRPARRRRRWLRRLTPGQAAACSCR